MCWEGCFRMEPVCSSCGDDAETPETEETVSLQQLLRRVTEGGTEGAPPASFYWSSLNRWNSFKLDTDCKDAKNCSPGSVTKWVFSF